MLARTDFTFLLFHHGARRVTYILRYLIDCFHFSWGSSVALCISHVCCCTRHMPRLWTENIKVASKF